MILTSLDSYYRALIEEQRQGPPNYRREIASFGYAEQDIAYAVVIDAQGGFKALRDLRQEYQKSARGGKKTASKTDTRPRRLIVPFVSAAASRTSKYQPFILWDKTDYALGSAIDKDEIKKCPKQADKFLELHEKLAEALPNEQSLKALIKFLRRSEDPSGLTEQLKEIAKDKKSVSSPNVIFQMVDDPPDLFLPGRREIAAYWAEHWVEYNRESNYKIGQCLSRGQKGPLARLHPPTKGVKDAQTSGAKIVSFNQNAFESYGLEGGANAPVSEEVAFAYTTVLNYLLRRENHRVIQLADSATVFWAEQPGSEEEAIYFLINSDGQTPDDNDNDAEDNLQAQPQASQMTAAQVRSYLLALREGRDVTSIPVNVDRKFYILSLAPNMARLSVRLWLVSTFGELADRVARHARDIHIVKQRERDSDFPPVAVLLSALAPLRRRKKSGADDSGLAGDKKNDADGGQNSGEKRDAGPPPNIAGALVRSILLGAPYPISAYQALLNRFRADGEISYPRAALIKGVLNRNFKQEVKPVLDTDRSDPAYLLGRLFAVLENIQGYKHRQEKGDAQKKEVINATIKDRFWGAASVTPAMVFPQLMRLSVHHLNKVDAPKVRIYYEKLVDGIVDKLCDFPKRLKLFEQGLFIVGYYQQRADLFKKRAADAGSGNEEGEELCQA